MSQLQHLHLINKLLEYRAAPPVLGFGISSPAQVKQAISAGASGAISGSAVVNIIEQNLSNQNDLLGKLGAFVTEMKAATIRN